MKILLLPIVVISLLLIQSCTSSRVVRPLKKGEQQISANLGGPLLGFAGMTIPMPLTSIAYARGITNDLTGFMGVHTTSMLFGVIQTDIGACYNVYHPDSSQFGVSVSPALNIAYDKWEKNSKLWPSVDINAYWEFTPNKSFIYTGVSNWFEFAKERAHGEKQEHKWLINPHLGYTYVRNKWNYNIETKWLVPNIGTKPNVVDYRGVGGKGAIGLYFTFTRKF